MTLAGYIVLLSVVSSEHPEVCEDASWNVSLIYKIHFTFSSGKEPRKNILLMRKFFSSSDQTATIVYHLAGASCFFVTTKHWLTGYKHSLFPPKEP